ncbi:MAG: tyrosine-type recombinase/integrase [Candidatus Marinimicrobia bacterium]|nr:tyrosine-type recombinase/integrase [Candidatus Neomarinimicrobiota bacterium]
MYRIEKGFSPVGVNTNLRALRTLFNFAVNQEYLAKSPLRDVPLVKVQHKDVRYLNEDELRSLNFAIGRLDLTDTWQKDARDLTLFLLHTGARVSEITLPAFTWKNDGQHALNFQQGKVSRPRSIPKAEQVRDILESRKGEPDGPFHFNKDMVRNRVKWLFEQAGIENASTHTLRKTAGSMYYLATRDIFATSRFLGHSNVTVTQNHYAGLIQSLQIEYHQQFEQALSRILYVYYPTTNQLDSPPTDPPAETPTLSRETTFVVAYPGRDSNPRPTA